LLDGVETFVHEILNASTLIDNKACSSSWWSWMQL
jgi:hypothetical protein